MLVNGGASSPTPAQQPTPVSGDLTGVNEAGQTYGYGTDYDKGMAASSSPSYAETRRRDLKNGYYVWEGRNTVTGRWEDLGGRIPWVAASSGEAVTDHYDTQVVTPSAPGGAGGTTVSFGNIDDPVQKYTAQTPLPTSGDGLVTETRDFTGAGGQAGVETGVLNTVKGYEYTPDIGKLSEMDRNRYIPASVGLGGGITAQGYIDKSSGMFDYAFKTGPNVDWNRAAPEGYNPDYSNMKVYTDEGVFNVIGQQAGDASLQARQPGWSLTGPAPIKTNSGAGSSSSTVRAGLTLVSPQALVSFQDSAKPYLDAVLGGKKASPVEWGLKEYKPETVGLASHQVWWGDDSVKVNGIAWSTARIFSDMADSIYKFKPVSVANDPWFGKYVPKPAVGVLDTANEVFNLPGKLALGMGASTVAGFGYTAIAVDAHRKNSKGTGRELAKMLYAPAPVKTDYNYSYTTQEGDTTTTTTVTGYKTYPLPKAGNEITGGEALQGAADTVLTFAAFGLVGKASGVGAEFAKFNAGKITAEELAAPKTTPIIETGADFFTRVYQTLNPKHAGVLGRSIENAKLVDEAAAKYGYKMETGRGFYNEAVGPARSATITEHLGVVKGGIANDFMESRIKAGNPDTIFGGTSDFGQVWRGAPNDLYDAASGTYKTMRGTHDIDYMIKTGKPEDVAVEAQNYFRARGVNAKAQGSQVLSPEGKKMFDIHLESEVDPRVVPSSFRTRTDEDILWRRDWGGQANRETMGYGNVRHENSVYTSSVMNWMAKSPVGKLVGKGLGLEPEGAVHRTIKDFGSRTFDQKAFATGLENRVGKNPVSAKILGNLDKDMKVTWNVHKSAFEELDPALAAGRGEWTKMTGREMYDVWKGHYGDAAPKEYRPVVPSSVYEASPLSRSVKSGLSTAKSTTMNAVAGSAVGSASRSMGSSASKLFSGTSSGGSSGGISFTGSVSTPSSKSGSLLSSSSMFHSPSMSIGGSSGRSSSRKSSSPYSSSSTFSSPSVSSIGSSSIISSSSSRSSSSTSSTSRTSSIISPIPFALPSPYGGDRSRVDMMGHLGRAYKWKLPDMGFSITKPKSRATRRRKR